MPKTIPSAVAPDSWAGSAFPAASMCILGGLPAERHIRGGACQRRYPILLTSPRSEEGSSRAWPIRRRAFFFLSAIACLEEGCSPVHGNALSSEPWKESLCPHRSSFLRQARVGQCDVVDLPPLPRISDPCSVTSLRKNQSMWQSHTIEVDGAFVGVAIHVDQGYRFHAADSRLDELHSSIWPTLDDVRRLARGAIDAATPSFDHAHVARTRSFCSRR